MRYELKILCRKPMTGLAGEIVSAAGEVVGAFPGVEHLFTKVEEENGLITTSYNIGTDEGEIRAAAERLGIVEPLVDPGTLVALAIVAAIGAIVAVILWQIKKMGATPLLYAAVGVAGISAVAGLIGAVRRG